MIDRRPHLLSAPNIPKPLHGLNPRSIMGREKWDAVRQEIYGSTNYHCAACGVHKSQARKHQWLEAHEIFEIDYRQGVATLIEIVPLCHFCHAFIHSGLTRIKARKKQITAQEVREIMQHGCELLRIGNDPIFMGTAELCDLVGVNRFGLRVMPLPSGMCDWGRWRMKWGNEEYRGKFKTRRDWERAYQ